MNYILCKTRLNTDFNRLARELNSTLAFQQLFDTHAPVKFAVLEEKERFESNSFFSGKTSYEIQLEDQILTLEVQLMQSTAETEYCYDLFFKLTSANTFGDGRAMELRKILDTTLANFRSKYNGEWIISDDELHYSQLK